MTRRRTTTLAGLALVGALALYGMALADHKGLQGLFAARGTAEPFHIHDHGSHFKLKAEEPIDVAIVGAQLHADGQTGWHTHPADSIVSVAAGAPGSDHADDAPRTLRQAHVQGRRGVRPPGRAAQLPQLLGGQAAQLRRRLLRPRGRARC